MNFQSPESLLLLLPLGGVIVALYLLKMKRRDVSVPATFLWPARTEEIRANSLFQKLRFSWLLVLQLIALTLLVAAFARPQSLQTGLIGETTVLVIDSGASMQAIDVKPSRFAEAKRLALEAIRSAQPSDRIALIEAGPSPRVVFSLSSDPLKQEIALDSVQPSDAEADVGPALRLASALVGNIDDARIVLLSDGDFEPITNFSPGKAAMVYKPIGETGDNLAINALGVTETQEGRRLYCGVKSHSDKPYNGTLSLYSDGKLLDSRSFQVGPKAAFGTTINAPSKSHVFEAKLDSPDYLKSDNYAACVVDPGASIRVLLVSKGDLFLERALILDPRVTLDRATTLPSNVGDRYDIVIFDGVPEQSVQARGVLTFGAAGTASPVTVQGSAKHPKFVSAEDVKTMKGVDLKPLFIDSAQTVSPKATGQVIASSSVGPLIVQASNPSQRQIYVAFEPLESDFPLQVAFPIFVANALDFLSGTTGADVLTVKAGVPFSVITPTEATLIFPDGRKSRITSIGGSVVIREIRSVGVYKLDVGGKSKTIYATLNSDRASEIAPANTLRVGNGVVHATGRPAQFADFWRPIAALCLLVLAVEWWLFARRS